MHMTASVIIPTFNRPDDLARALRSIAAQTVRPEEIIVVDDGALADMPERRALEALGIRCIYRRKAQGEKKGLTVSRNIGVRLAAGDIIMFFDDDVELEPDYIAHIKRVYETHDDPALGGVAGVNLNIGGPSPAAWLDYLYNLLFLLSPLRPCRVTPSGFSEHPVVQRVNPARRLQRADFLSGALFSFAGAVARGRPFAEDYATGYCQGEDKDYTLPLSRTHNLYIEPRARLRHYNSPVERMDKRRRGCEYVMSVYRIFSDCVRGPALQEVLFWYSLLGLLLKRTAVAAVTMDRGEWLRVRGMLDAGARICRRGTDRR